MCALICKKMGYLIFLALFSINSPNKIVVVTVVVGVVVVAVEVMVVVGLVEVRN